MGEDFLRKKAKRSKKLQDKAYQDILKRKNLFSNRPELLEREFFGDITTKIADFSKGKHLLGKLENGNMQLLDGEAIIGRIGENNIKELKALNISDVFAFEVVRFSPMSSTVYLRLRN